MAVLAALQLIVFFTLFLLLENVFLYNKLFQIHGALPIVLLILMALAMELLTKCLLFAHVKAMIQKFNQLIIVNLSMLLFLIVGVKLTAILLLWEFKELEHALLTHICRQFVHVYDDIKIIFNFIYIFFISLYLINNFYDFCYSVYFINPLKKIYEKLIFYKNTKRKKLKF